MSQIWHYIKEAAVFINFIIFVAILVKFAGKPLKNFLVNRSKAVSDKLAETERALNEAKALKEKYDKRLAGLEGEIAEFKKTVLDAAEKEKKRILEDSEVMAARIREQAKLMYEQEAKDLMGKIRTEIAKMTVEKAEGILREKMTKDDHEKMVNEFIEKLRSMN